MDFSHRIVRISLVKNFDLSKYITSSVGEIWLNWVYELFLRYNFFSSYVMYEPHTHETTHRVSYDTVPYSLHKSNFRVFSFFRKRKYLRVYQMGSKKK